MLTLYFAPGSSSFAVHIAPQEIGVPFEGKPMSFEKDDLRSPSYLKLNPWMSFAASTLHPARRHGLDHARDVWGIADRRLGSGWALDRYSIADIHLFRLYWRFANSLKPAPETFPNLTAHYARMMARPAVQRTIEIETAIGYELPA